MTKQVSVEAQIKAMEERLEAGAKMNDKNALEMDNGLKAWEETLPEGASPELVEKIADHNRNFSVAYNRVAGRHIVPHIRDNKEISNIEHRLHTPLVDFGFSAARVETKDGKPSREQVRASMAFRHDLRLSEELDKVADELADLWDLAE